MPITKHTQISNSEAVKLIEEARNAELCRDISALKLILTPILEDCNDEPLIADLESSLQAEILRLCGFFLSYYGRSHNLKSYQERGKDFLIRAIEIFNKKVLPHKAAETKVTLSLCYWHEGAISECETILKETEAEYTNNQLHPVYIQICINRVITLLSKSNENPSNAHQGLEIIKKLSSVIDFCEDVRLKAMYHNHAGIYYRYFKESANALYHYKEGIKAARKGGNFRFVAINHNNIAFLYKETKDFHNAHQYVDKAINFYRDLKEVGWLAHTLDTKATIYFEEGKYLTALNIINQALELFQQGEDYSGLVDTLFNKSKILLKLDRSSEALSLLAEVISIATMQIGKFAAKKYADEFAKLIYPLNNTSYVSEVKAFKANLLRKHLTDADGQVTKAAETLGISHQNLSDILNNQFPELFIELGIRRRSRRNGKKRDILKNIAPVKLSDSQMSYDSGLRLNEDASYYTFALNGKCLAALKTKHNVVVLVEATEQATGATVIMQNQKTDEFHCGVLEIDKLTGIFYLNDSSVKDDFPFLLDDFKYYGKIVGYCLLEEDKGTQILFRPF
ncbi:MAG TPA: tetratricopeptide repeat protein [Pyrinomonadaceae bacterium]